MLENENLRLGDLIEWGIKINQAMETDEIDWAELERSSSDEDDVLHSSPRDVYGVPMDTYEICGKVDVSTRITSCWFCRKKAHPSCLEWIAREDPRKPRHFLWQCPPPPQVWFLEG